MNVYVCSVCKYVYDLCKWSFPLTFSLYLKSEWAISLNFSIGYGIIRKMPLSNKKQNESCEAAPPLSLSYVPAQHILVMFDYTLR